MSTATITSKGQLTIPKQVRTALHLGTGDRVTFRVRPDGVAEIQPETVELMSLFGVLKASSRHVSLDEMERAIAHGGSRR